MHEYENTRKIKNRQRRLLTNEELLSSRGGYEQQWWCLFTTDQQSFWAWWTYHYQCTAEEATNDCNDYYRDKTPPTTCECGCK